MVITFSRPRSLVPRRPRRQRRCVCGWICGAASTKRRCRASWRCWKRAEGQIDGVVGRDERRVVWLKRQNYA